MFLLIAMQTFQSLLIDLILCNPLTFIVNFPSHLAELSTAVRI